MAGADIIKRWSCEVFAILRCYAVLLTSWGSQSVPSSRAKKSKKVNLFLSVPCRHIVGVEIHLHWFLTSPLYGGKVTSFMPQPPYHLPSTHNKQPWYPMNMRLCGPQHLTFWVTGRFFSLPEIKLHIVQPTAQSAYQLHYPSTTLWYLW